MHGDSANIHGVSSETETSTQQASSSPKTPLAGKTLDFTVLASVRALETLTGDAWSRYRKSYGRRSLRKRSLESAISQFADSGVFALSAGVVMWAWFYLPARLPRAYNRWIGEAAQVDPRLLQVLRDCRAGAFVYGRRDGDSVDREGAAAVPSLQSMCRDYGWPLEWGDPARTVPVPCEMVHMGAGPSCHRHALVRFGRAFRFALAMYLPLQLLVKLRRPSGRALRAALVEAARSSAFLGAFISLFYYSVCLARTRLGPKIFDRKVITPQMWDDGLCIGAGCLTCGWSILIEAPRRRQELAYFVAPRAVATVLPRRYDRKVRIESCTKSRFR